MIENVKKKVETQMICRNSKLIFVSLLMAIVKKVLKLTMV